MGIVGYLKRVNLFKYGVLGFFLLFSSLSAQIKQVAAGVYHTVALKEDGTVVCWGLNNYGQCNVPSGLTGVKQVAAGGFYTLALKEDGTIVSWGANEYGQCDTPPGLGAVKQIEAGFTHTVALKEDGTVVCWGDDCQGECTVPSGLTGVKQVDAGTHFTVALKEDGTVVCWGRNYIGGLPPSPEPLTDVKQIAAAEHHVVALKEDGTVVCFGINYWGECEVPSGLTGVKQVAAGGYHTVALKQDGNVVAWGVNWWGECNVPSGLSGVKEVAAGFAHTVALKEDGTVVCWGDNRYGQCDVPLSLLIGVSPPSPYNFRTVPVGSSKEITFTIKNSSSENITIKSINITGANSSEFSILNDNCSGKTILPGCSSTFKVRFTPFSYGDKSAVLHIYYRYENDEYEITVSLSGKGGIPGNSNISGIVYDGLTKRPVSDVEVIIGDYSATTDENGIYSISDIPSGNFEYTILKTGYNTLKGTIEIPPSSSIKRDFVIYPDLGKITITGISSKYKGHVYYLDGVDFNVEFTANVDWALHQPGKVIFKTPKGDYEVLTQEKTAKKTFNMGRDFGPSGKLYVIAVSSDGTYSETKEADFVVMKSIPNSGVLVPCDLGDTFYYKTSIGPNWDFINQGLDGSKIPGDIPVFGGKGFYLRLIPTLEAEIKSNEASFTLKEEGAIPSGKIAGIEIKATPHVGINGTYILPAGYWDWDGKVGLETNFGYEQTFPFFLGPIPMYAAISFKLAFNTELVIKDINPLLLNGNFTIGPYIRGSLGAGINHIAAVEGWLGGGADAIFQYPDKPNFKKLTIYIDGGYTIYALLWSWENQLFKVEWSWPENKLEKEVYNKSGIIERNYIKKEPYGKFIGGVGGETKILKTEDKTYLVKTSPLQENVYPISDPSISSSGNYTYLTYIYDDPNRTSTNRTEVVFSSFNGSSWTNPQIIDDDGTGDFHPFILTFSDGSSICSWENVKTILSEDAQLIDALTNLEIKTAIYDPSTNTWSTYALTDNTYLDRSPKISGKEKNNIIITWISNEDNDLFGSSEKPNKIYYSQFNGSNWTIPQIIKQIPYPIFGYDFIYDGNKGYLVFCLDTDDNIQTDTDRELYCIKYENSTWSDLIRLTDDKKIDSSPHLSFDKNGDLLLIWLKEDGLYSVKNLDMENSKIIRNMEYSTNLSDFKIANSSDGKISIIWSKPSEYSSDIWTILYDPIFDLWGTPQKITDDKEVEKWLTGCFYGNNTLLVVYNRTEIEEKTKSKILKNGLEVKYEMPQPISTDLYFLMMNLGDDIALKEGSLSVDPTNPNPDEDVNFSVIVVNLGNKVVDNIPVAFYKGNPSEGEEIGRAYTETPIAPGEEKPVYLKWKINSTSPIDIYAVVDPDYTLTEDTNRNNNIQKITILKPDLVIENVSTEKIGDFIIISPRISNFGASSSKETNLRIRKNSIDGDIIFEGGIPSLTSGQTIELSFPYNFNDFSSLETGIFIIVDQDNIVDESNENNNTFIIHTIFVEKGDINKDKGVDISDVIICLRMAIGLDPVDRNLADMNGDGEVDITDVILILRKAIGL